MATPIHEAPVLLTHKIDATQRVLGCWYSNLLDGSYFNGVNKEWEIKVKVFSWKLDGKLFPNITFSWIYFAEAACREQPPI